MLLGRTKARDLGIFVGRPGVGTAPGPGSVGSHRGKSTPKRTGNTFILNFKHQNFEIDFWFLAIRPEYILSQKGFIFPSRGGRFLFARLCRIGF